MINRDPLTIYNFRFYFFNYKYDELHAQFQKHLNHNITKEKLYEELAKKSSKIKKLYENISKDHNNHSLCMLVEQIERNNIETFTQYNNSYPYRPPKPPKPYNVAMLSIMLTGDYSLDEINKQKSEHLEQFEKYFQHKLGKVKVLHVPHHGSKNSNSLYAFKLFKNVYGILSHGIDSKYNHPHYKTCYDLEKAKHKPIYVNEKNFYSISNFAEYER